MSKVLFVTSEAAPLIKTGGLADVCGNLPVALQKLRWSVRLMLPAYPAAVRNAAPVKTIAQLQIPGIAGEIQLLEGKLPGTRLPVWLVNYAEAFSRDGNPYVDDKGLDWPDNAERFALLARVAVEISQGRAGLHWRPDIVHCNDWQTGLIPALLSQEIHRPATVFTIHNLAYQGLFPTSTFQSLGLPAALWSHDGLEFHEQLSFIKGGLAFADQLTTVSPSYAKEIQTPSFGCGLEGLLQHRAEALTGILNGIDDKEWNPETDPHITRTYTANTLNNKALNKRTLQKFFALPDKSDVLLLGSVGRLVPQKGIDLLLEILPELSKQPIQLVLLGSGDKSLELALQKAAQQYPDTLSIRLNYDETLAHRIEAGADAFLMPSRFEPCGLNQLYSLRYGTLPVVHAVGGLKDTVIDATQTTLGNGTATGFLFNQPDPDTLLKAIFRALNLYTNKTQWQQVAKTAMQQSFNWEVSAHLYAKLYRLVLKGRLNP